MRSRPYFGAAISTTPPFFDPNDPAVWLPGYRAVVYSAERGDPIVYSLCAVDDVSALAAAREVADTLVFELWDGLCMISRHEPAA
jgi:hypothetical protein